jgi:hypothetical protein
MDCLWRRAHTGSLWRSPSGSLGMSEMQIPATQLPPRTLQRKPAHDIAMALRTQVTYQLMGHNYRTLMREMIFSQKIPNISEKTLRKYQRTLEDVEAHDTLAIIWKETCDIPDQAISDADLTRSYQDCTITAHRLAVDTAESTDELAAANSRLRNIGLAASSYRLVDRVGLRLTKVSLRGTPLLHEFMCTLGEMNTETIIRTCLPFVFTAEHSPCEASS